MTLIVLNGATGSMGKKVVDVVEKNSKKFKIVLGIDINYKKKSYKEINILNKWPQNFKADVLIDFSHPDSLEDVLKFATTNKMPLVIATTGYSKIQIQKIKNASEEIPIFFTFNMSLGVNLMVNLVTKAYSILKENFNIEIIEKHHNQKIDSPSGTALMLAQAINEKANGRFKYVYNRQSIRKKREENEIGIHSIRGGTIVGEHEVLFAGNDEILTISHTATSKSVFAQGALKAAEFIKTKKQGLFNMTDIVRDI